jgi:hypothetical protein
MAQWNLYTQAFAPSRAVPTKRFNDDNVTLEIRVATCDGMKSVVLLFPHSVVMAPRAIQHKYSIVAL